MPKPSSQITKIQQQSKGLQHKIMGIKTSEYFSGPFPHPEHLKKYEETCPGAANRIIKITESQVSHRQNLETKRLKSDINNERLGMHYALVVVLVFMICGAIFILKDKSVAGYFSLFGPAVLQGGVFGYYKIKEQQSQKVQDKDIKQEKEKIVGKRQKT